MRQFSDNEGQLLSIVVPCFNEEQAAPYLYDELAKFADMIEDTIAVEIILVDDGSRDATWNQISICAAKDPRVRGIRLSRNFGHQAALTCGYQAARGDAIVCLDADLQDPPEVITEMIEAWRGGADIVYAVRASREGESWLKLFTAKAFYRLIGAIGATPIQHDCGDFRLLSRRALRSLLNLGEQHRFLRGLVCWIGFPTAQVTYDRRRRVAGTTKYHFLKMLSFAADAIISFSRMPLKIAYHLAIIFAFAFIGYLAYSLVMYQWFGREIVPGWPSIIVAVIAFGTANLICLAILGEYIGRIYEETKRRPLYIVQEEVAQTTDGLLASGRMETEVVHEASLR